MGRTAAVTRETTETKINLTINLDGAGRAVISTGIGFFDHMLTLLAGHSLFDLSITCDGDVHVDGHHTVEDVGRALGSAVKDCLGDRRGIRRYGHTILPMDESLVTAAVDLGGRAATVLAVEYPVPTIGFCGNNSGTDCRCIFDPINARFASSCSKNGIKAAAADTTCTVETAIKSTSSGLTVIKSC